MPGANGEIERRWAREQEVMLARIERDRLERDGERKAHLPRAVVRGYERVEKKLKYYCQFQKNWVWASIALK